MTDYSLNDPTYPHVSVFCKSGTASADHSYAIATAYLPKEIIDTKVHNVKITYQRRLDKVDFR